MIKNVTIMANSSLALFAIPIAVGLALIYFSISSKTQNGVMSFSVNPPMFIAGILIAVIGAIIVGKLTSNSS